MAGMREPTGFRELASKLAAISPDPSGILSIFAERAVGNSFVGSIADHIRFRRRFLDNLDLDDRAETQRGLEQARAYLDRRIESEQTREDAEAKASAERFV